MAYKNDPTAAGDWTRRRLRDGNTNSQFHSWIHTDPMTGLPYVSWFDAANDRADGLPGDIDNDDMPNTEVQRFATVSTDGGNTWLTPTLISDGVSRAGSQFFGYGHYNGNDIFAGMGYDSWPDNSTSTTGEMGIYTDRTIISGHVITVTSTSEDNIYHVQLDDDDNPQFVYIWENTAPTATPTFMTHKDALEGLVFDLGDGIDVVFVTPKVIDYLSASGGFIDLGESRMIVDYPESSPLATTQARITSGYNGGNWDGSGIRSSAAASAGNTGIGFAEATDLFTTFPAVFSGQEVDDTTVLLRYTGYGDTDLNGNVNLGDFNRLAGNYGESNRRWPHGDFNYNTQVNLDDFNLLAANYGMMFGDDAEDPGNGFVEYTYEDLLEMLLGGA